jgi:carboxypeptidase T
MTTRQNQVHTPVNVSILAPLDELDSQMRYRILCFAAAFFSHAALAETSPAGENGPWVVHAYFKNEQSLNELLKRAAPWKLDRRRGELTIDVQDRYEYQQLLNDGFVVEIDPELTFNLNRKVERLPGQINGVVGYPCYRTVEETYTDIGALVASHSTIASIVDIGDSWKKTQNAAQGYDLRVLKITNSAITGVKPILYMNGGLHAREYATAETVTRFGEFLINNYGVNPDVTWIVDNHEIHLLLQANPDGRKVAEISTTKSQRKNRNENFCPMGPLPTDLGVDLNRNFRFDWGGLQSSSIACDLIFRGPSAQSEPETTAIVNYVTSIFPDQRNEVPLPALDYTTSISPDASGVYFDIHSYSAGTWWPWGNSGAIAPNATQLQTFGRKLAFFNGLAPEKSSNGGAIGGASDDFTYDTLGVATYTIELQGSDFWPACTFYEANMVTGNLAAFFYAARVARLPYRLPAGPDALNLTATPATASSGTINLTASLNDQQYNNSIGTEPTQNIASAQVYLTPPWQAGAPSIGSMTAVDGSFNSGVEAAQFTLNTNLLAFGKQLVYVQAVDSAGNVGPVYSVFVTRSNADLLFANGLE